MAQSTVWPRNPPRVGQRAELTREVSTRPGDGITGIVEVLAVRTLRGRNGEAPLSSTSANFVRSLPLAAIAAAAGIGSLRAAPAGVVLALVSGSVTSGLGYVLWYRALKELTTTTAAVVQLLVPVLAAFGGVMFLAERVSVRLMIGGVMVLGRVTAALMRPVSNPARRARGGSPAV